METNVICVWLILAFLVASVSSLSLEYVVAPSSDECIEESTECHDLSYYASHSDTYFTSDSTLTFLPGTHILDHNGPIVISDVSNLTLQGDGQVQDGSHWTVKQPNVIISCHGANSGFLFQNFDDLEIVGLTITNCGFNLTEDLRLFISTNYLIGLFNWEFSLSLKTFYSLLAINGTNLVIEQTSVQNSTGHGLVVANVYSIEIISSWFYRNNINCAGIDGFGGNVKILYLQTTSCPRSINPIINTVIIQDVSMSFGKNCGRSNSQQYQYIYSANGLDVYRGSGLTFNIYNISCLGPPSIFLDDVRLISNSAETGSNIVYTGTSVEISINRMNCSEGYAALFSSGFLFLSILTLSFDRSIELRIANSMFINNKVNKLVSGTGTGLFVFAVAKTYKEVIVSECLFSGNEGVSVMRFEKSNSLLPEVFQVNLIDVTITKSPGFNQAGTYDYAGALVLVFSSCYANRLNVLNTPFTGIHLVHSRIAFHGNNLVQNNSFTNGGGMVLNGLSNVFFLTPTTVSFINNHADHLGGGIYIPDDSFQNYFGDCFYQIHDPTDSITPNVTIYAINNTAGTTGAFLNGAGNLDSCYYNGLVAFSKEKLFAGITGFDFLLGLIEPKTFKEQSMFISQTPVGVVTCNATGGYSLNNRIIGNLSSPIEFVPGKEFNISLVAVNNESGKSNGEMIVSLYNCSSKSISGCLENKPFEERSIASRSKCENVSTVLRGNEYTKLIVIKYSTHIQIPYDLFPLLYILFKPADCPPGFVNKDVCVCNEYLSALEGVSCDINTTSITTSGRIWVGYDSTTNETLYALLCPFDYCKEGEVTFNLIDSPDDQCAYNRAGILCGGCADGYSLLLGSNECGKCPNNNYLSLLLVFGAAGIVLVIFLILLNLTVSVGTINGLIFYANIVKMNERVFIPFSPSHPTILRQFISFLNLDFGLETCFVNGLSTYSKTWLQFLFPFYLWFMMISLILLSRRSTKISKLLGNNTVKVFATLLLLSYTKIIRAIGQSVSLERIHTDSTRYFVWRYDGRFHFRSPEFIILYSFALLVALCLVLPYTLFLISLPCIDKIFAKIRWNFLWLKPFADAYSGPFNRGFQFWVGLLIVYRVVITTVIGATIKKVIPLSWNINFMIILLNLLVNFKAGLYTNAYLNFLESWFLSNVLALSVVALSDDQELVRVGSIISISLVLITFFCICVFHVSMKLWNYFCVKNISSRNRDKSVLSVTNPSVLETPRDKSTLASYEDAELREPFLEIINESYKSEQ